MAIESGDGIVLVAGPTGSGKSTALKLFLELVHFLYPYKSIFTIENPPEYRIEGAKQLAVPQIEGWSFEKVLREALRSDPDVIMVGEIREPDTAKTAVQAALTGHQVFSTVHARDITSIVERIKTLGLDLSELIKENIARLLVAQRLVPKLCPHCRVKGEFKDFGVVGYLSKGCEKCEGTGVSGRVVLEEAVGFKEFFQSHNWQLKPLSAEKLVELKFYFFQSHNWQLKQACP
ncbi:MAG: ATPase, T2SS/T4P/T4SS family, partial [Aquificaceae bacterium]|nr:ATPase, T2SS/T4P/T4SS family [Aquificaceae bacterium]